LAQLLAAAVQGRAATGPRAGQKVLRFGDRVEVDPDGNASPQQTPGLARTSGFSLHAGVAVPANDWSHCVGTPDGRPLRRSG
jgi:hypothetical protein